MECIEMNEKEEQEVKNFCHATSTSGNQVE